MLDFEECWGALERRDAGATGRFFYGVRTTKVYCRPGCTSRLPLRRNTMFFETQAEAEAAGLRACKRCRPDLYYKGEDENLASREPERVTDMERRLERQRHEAGRVAVAQRVERRIVAALVLTQ